MAIFITGDCHGSFEKFNLENFPEQSSLTKNDIMIICGDFGGVWNWQGETEYEKDNLDWLQSLPFTVCFVDGNHECFPRLYKYPQREWHGGQVHEIRPNVLHLMRGQVFNIQGNTFFTFGGARSHDIYDGILEPEEKDKIFFYKWRGKVFRINKRTWWEEEMPNDEELQTGLNNLSKYNNKIDYIITHCPPTRILNVLNRKGEYKSDRLNKYLDNICDTLNFKKFFYGHMHVEHKYKDMKDLKQYQGLYRDIIRLK